MFKEIRDILTYMIDVNKNSNFISCILPSLKKEREGRWSPCITEMGRPRCRIFAFVQHLSKEEDAESDKDIPIITNA